MTTDKVLAEKAGGIGRMTLNNPERHNAVSLEMWQAADAILADFEADTEVRVVVVTGAGERAFASGADISKFEEERSSQAAIERYSAITDQTSARLYNLAKPTIARIRGYCMGGGLAFALCCDLRIAAEDAQFAIPAAKLSIGYAFPGIKRLVHLVRPTFAKEILYTARRFSAAEGDHMGLVNRVVAVDELDRVVDEYAATLAANAPLTIAAAKLAIDAAITDEGARDLAAVDAAVERCFAAEDYVEGRRAFMEKRKPAFVGR